MSWLARCTRHKLNAGLANMVHEELLQSQSAHEMPQISVIALQLAVCNIEIQRFLVALFNLTSQGIKVSDA